MVYLPDQRRPYFRNSDPKARALACSTTIDVCLADESHCWSFNGKSPEETEPKVEIPPEFWFMWVSLLYTDVYDSIFKRQGRSLIAQSLVSEYFSEQLSDDHWVRELDNLVATSHARTQTNAWSIASDEDHAREGEDGYINYTPREKFGDFCGPFKYRPQGYGSIHFAAFLIVCCTLPVLFILALDWSLIKNLFDVWGDGETDTNNQGGTRQTASGPPAHTAPGTENRRSGGEASTTTSTATGLQDVGEEDAPVSREESTSRPIDSPTRPSNHTESPGITHDHKVSTVR